MKTLTKIGSWGLSLALAMSAVACSSSDDATADNGTDTTTDTTSTVSDDVYNKGGYFIATKTDDGTEWVIQAKNLDGDLLQSKNMMELPQTEYTWVFNGHTAIGMVYQQQFAGIGYGLRYTAEDAPLTKVGEFRIDTRFSNYGFFNGQLVTSVAGQTYTDSLGQTHDDGATFAFYNYNGDAVTLDHTKTIATEPIAKNGEQITFSSIVDNGDGTFFTAMVESDFHQTGTGNGSSIGTVRYPDSVWVAKMDKDLNVLKIYRDNRISYAAGQYRSQVLRSLWKADDGTVYAFSNSFNDSTTLKAGALRIKPGADTFDPDYYFDLETPAEGYRFRRVWHMTGNIFLLEIYNEKNITTISAGHQFALVDMANKTFKWVTGLPAKNLITSGTETGGVPMYHDGSIWLPITEFGKDASVYTVDPQTAVATKKCTIKGATEIRTVGFIGE